MKIANIEIPEVPIPHRIILAEKKRHNALKRAKAKKAAGQDKKGLLSTKIKIVT